MEKIVDKNKKTWPDKLSELLWVYKTTIKTATQATPYALVFDGEAAFLLEIHLPPLRVIIHEKMTNKEKANLCLAELEALNEDRLAAQQNLELYEDQISNNLHQITGMAIETVSINM